MTAATPAYNVKKAWFVSIVVIVVAIFVACVNFRQMTVVPLLTTYFDVDTAIYGNVTAIVSAFSIVGALLSGFVMAKIGPRKLMIGCVSLFIISIVLQIVMAYSGAGFVMWSFMNAFGYFAYGAWMPAPPLVISAWFPAERRGFPNSIASLWISLAMMLVLTFSSPLVSLGGDSELAWTNLWWALLVCMVAGLVLLLVFAKMPAQEDSFLETAESSGKNVTMIDAFKSGGVWMLILMFFCFGFGTTSFGSYYPTYLNADPSIGGLGMDLAAANSYSSIASWVMIAMGFIWGFVLNKIPNRNYSVLCLVVIALMGFGVAVMFLLPSIAFVVPFMIFWGLVSRLYPPLCFTILPEILDTQEECSVADGIMSLASNSIGAVTNSIIGMCAVVSWNSCAAPASGFALVGVCAAIALIPLYRRKYNSRHAVA